MSRGIGRGRSAQSLRRLVQHAVQRSVQNNTEICAKAGITTKHLSGIMNNRAWMTLDAADRILAAVGCTLELRVRIHD